MPSRDRNRKGKLPPCPNRLSATLGAVFAILVGIVWTSVARAESVDAFLEPYQTTHVGSPEIGAVNAVLIKEGEAVRAGQILVTLDDKIHVAMLAIAKQEMESTGQLQASEAEWVSRRNKYEKLLELRKFGNASSLEVERAETDLEIAEGAWLAAREYQASQKLEYEKIQLQIDRRKLASPFDGYVTIIWKRVGEVVSPADPNVVTVVRLDMLSAMFMVPLDQAKLLKPNQSVRVQLSDTDKSVDGKVEYVSPVADSKSGTVEVKVSIPNAEEALRSGQRCALQLKQELS